MLISKLAYFMLPAYAANMAPVLGRFFPMNFPLDFNRNYAGQRVLGNHKTVVGTLLGLLAAFTIGYIQQETGRAMLLGSGALLGDVVKSFVKRRLGIKPGKSFIPWDQIDFTIGALAMASLVYFPGWMESGMIITLSMLGHIGVNHLSFYAGIRKEKW